MKVRKTYTDPVGDMDAAIRIAMQMGAHTQEIMKLTAEYLDRFEEPRAARLVRRLRERLGEA